MLRNSFLIPRNDANYTFNMKKTLLLSLLLFSIFCFSQKNWDIRFYNETSGKEILIFADNEEIMPMSAKFDFKLDNLISTLSNNEIIVIPAKAKKILIAKLTPIKPNAGNKFSYNNTYNFGNALQEDYDKDYIYYLPFEKGKTQRIYQGYNGKFSHQNTNALDFDLKIGDKIFAAREGIVVDVVKNNTKSCPDISCAKFNNKIIIMHRDGTFADYAHLKYNGSEVNIGDEIEKGQLIGYSGNTGFSNGPHLHFSVFINRINGDRTYLKTKFRTSVSEATLLEENKSYPKNY